MKNILFVGALALTTACMSGEQASAWINSQFGVGLNWNWASGGNSFGYGLIRDGQPGGAEFYHSLQAVPAYPQPTNCAPTYPTNPVPQAHCAPTGPIPVPAIAPTSAPTAPAGNATQSLYRAAPRYQAAPSYHPAYYNQPRRY